MGSFDIGLENDVGLLKLDNSQENNDSIMPSAVEHEDGVDDSPMLPPSDVENLENDIVVQIPTDEVVKPKPTATIPIIGSIRPLLKQNSSLKK